MPGVDPISTGVEAAISIGETVAGLIGQGKAKKEGERLSKTRPKRQTSQYAKDDLALSESELSNPMSAGADRAYTTQSEKEFGTSIGAITRGGGGVNNIGDVYARGEEGRTNLAILKDQARLQKVNNVLRSYQMMNEEDQANFAFNEVAPWKDAAAANAQKKAAADAMVAQGIGMAGSTAMQGGKAKSDQSAYDKYFGNNGGVQPPQTYSGSSMMAPSALQSFGGGGGLSADMISGLGAGTGAGIGSSMGSAMMLGI